MVHRQLNKERMSAMATVQDILFHAGGNYPSRVKQLAGEAGWLDLSRTVRIVIKGHDAPDAFDGICLLNPEKELAILNSGDRPVSIAKLVIAEIQGKTTQFTGDDISAVERFLNIVADERVQAPGGAGQVQTSNAVIARRLISRFFMTRRKGLVW